MEYNGKIVEIMAMSECPNKCEHCFIRYKGHIEFNELEKIMENYTKKYNKVILNGTELLMNKKYIELCSKYGQNFIYTNGMLLTKESRELLKKSGINRLSISLHYGIQEQISKSGLSQISKTIIDCVNEGFEVRALCTISKDNYLLLPKIVDYVYSLGAKGIKFINMMKEGKADHLGDIFLNRTQLIEFFDLLEKVRNQYDKNEFYITRNGAFGDDKNRNNNFECPAGVNSVIIAPNYKVYPCNGLLYDEYCIGHWDENGVYIDKEFKCEKQKCLALERQIIK